MKLVALSPQTDLILLKKRRVLPDDIYIKWWKALLWQHIRCRKQFPARDIFLPYAHSTKYIFWRILYFSMSPGKGKDKF